jgi:hypothetical protein
MSITMPRVGGPWWGVLVVVAACNSSFPPVLQTSSNDRDDSGVGLDANTVPTDAGEIDIPASNGSWQVDSDVTLYGTGSGSLGAIDLQHGVGTITFSGMKANAFFLASSRVPTTASGAVDDYMEVIAVQPGRIIVTWIECDTTNLASAYYETTDGIDTSVPVSASGTCNIVEQPTAESVSEPATSIPAPRVVTGFTIAGSQLAFDGSGAGQAEFGGATWTAFPFHTLDCTGCATEGWYELHTLFVDPALTTACVGILYLWEPPPNGVALAYLACLPSVTNPTGAAQIALDATWTKG